MGSGVLVHRDIVYLSGQVGIIENIGASDVVQQTQETLVKIEKLLADVGTNKSNILEARIWLKDIKRDFAAMNGVLLICDGIFQMTTILFVKVKVHNIVNTGLERLGGP